jgi:outer membrane receptor protein involved in Fe transport
MNVLNQKSELGRVSPLALMLALSFGGVAAAHAQTGGRAGAPGAKAAGDDNVEVIVTGVLAKTKAKKANVSYSVLTADDMQKFTPISADDMLRDMPGTVVETNDGVARNEVFTRGMTAGTGANTSGYFWTTILEDGLPVTPFKFGGFQDGYFYRADISTSRVESVRGGSSATAITTSVGATFNYLSGKIRPGASVQTRFGFEGENSHLSWKQVDLYDGWLNRTGDFGASISGFVRASNGQVDPGYDLNKGGQFKINVFKSYDTAGGGHGTITGTLKHLDDTNTALTSFSQPVYGYGDNPKDVPGFGRDVDLFLRGGEAMMPDYRDPGAHSLDPRKGFRYRQDAVWLKWDYDTGGRWSYSAAGKIQTSSVRGQAYAANALTSLTSTAAVRDNMGLNIDNLDRTPGYYEFYDANGTLMARVANNVAGSQLGTDYRTGAACPKVTSTTSAGRCVVYNILPNRNLDMGGGTVVGSIKPYPTTTLPASGTSQDLVLTTRIEDSWRQSRDTLFNVVANYRGDTLTANMGVYFAHSNQEYFQWGAGSGVSAYANGQVRNLNVQYVTASGTRYQLTNAGGWGGLGGGLFTTAFQYASITELSPYLGVAWSPTEHWDFNASVKRSMYRASTYSETYDTRNPGAASLANGGLDGNPLTVYDNTYFVDTPTKNISAQRHVAVTDWTASAGYNFTPSQKIYYRYTVGYQPASGVVQRYSTVATLDRPLGPTATMKGHEIAWLFNFGRALNGQVTWFYSDWGLNDYPTAIDTDNVTTYLLPSNFNRYFTRGVEAWANWKVTRNLSWNTSVTFNNGKNQAIYTWLNTGANGMGRADDVLRIDSGIMNREPRWTLSNTLSYTYHDLWFNLRHRWMDRRKMVSDPADTRYLPAQDNLDASVQYVGLKNTRIALDVRNVLDSTYVSAYDTAFSNLPSGVQKYDIYNQLPNSMVLLKRNAPRSYWLTLKHDF